MDDEESIAQLIKTVLRNSGYQPVAVTDSSEALTLFKTDPEKFDLIITDHTMPKLTGIELIAQLRKIRPDIPVILCTGFSDMINEKEAENQKIHFSTSLLISMYLLKK